MAKVSGLTWDQALVCMTKNLNNLSKRDLWDGQSRRFCLGWSALPFTCNWVNHAYHHSACERIQQKVMRDPFIINALCKYDRDFLFSQDRLAHTQLNGCVWTHPKVKHSSKNTEKKTDFVHNKAIYIYIYAFEKALHSAIITIWLKFMWIFFQGWT